MENVSKNKALVFLDVSIDGDPLRRMIFELFTDVAPKTAENFRALCTGEKGFSLKTGKPLHYKGTFFHRIIKGHVAEAGDFLRKNGDYGESIYGGKFPDESPKLRHDGPGLLSMAIADRDEKGSLFFVTFRADHRHDRKRVVFGKLVDGYEVLKMIENAGDDNGIPAVTVKIVNSGELHDGKETTVENNNVVKRKRKHKKSSRKTRKRRRYYTSESDSSTDADSESSDSDTDSDSDASSLSDTSSSSDDRRKRRKRSKRDRHRRGKKKGRRHEKRRRKWEKKSKRKSKRDSISDRESGSSSQDDDAVGVSDVKHKTSGNQFPIAEPENKKVSLKEGEAAHVSEREEGEFPRENGGHLNNDNGVNYEREDDRRPDVVDDLASKSRSGNLSPIRTKNKSMIISPGTAARSADIAAQHNRSRSPIVSRSPQLISRSRSNTPARSESSKSPLRTKRERSVSLTPRARSQFLRSRSRSASISPIRRRATRSPPPRISHKRSSVSRSPIKPSRSVSRSPVRPAHRSASRAGRAQPRGSPSPVRASRRSQCPSHSGSPVSAGRRAKSPVSVRGRSSSRSPSVDGSPKRIRRGRGFSDRYSYVRRFRSQSRSPDRSPVRAYRYGGKMDRDRYPSYRRSPRRYRSPPRARTPPRRRSRRSRTRSPSASRSPIRYRGRRTRSPSASHSPIRYRGRRYSPSPYRSRTPVERYRAPSPRVLKRKSPSWSKSQSLSSRGSQSPRHDVSARSRSSSGSPLTRKPNLVSYGDGSPDSGRD